MRPEIQLQGPGGSKGVAGERIPVQLYLTSYPGETERDRERYRMIQPKLLLKHHTRVGVKGGRAGGKYNPI